MHGRSRPNREVVAIDFGPSSDWVFLLTVMAAYVSVLLVQPHTVTLRGAIGLIGAGALYVLVGMYGRRLWASTASAAVAVVYFAIQIPLGATIVSVSHNASTIGLVLMPLAAMSATLPHRWMLIVCTLLVVAEALPLGLLGGWLVAVQAGIFWLVPIVFVVVFSQVAVRERQARAEVERLAAAVADANRKLEVASRYKSAFLANMSHELRTPLNAIIGFCRLVMRRSKDVLPARQYENLEKILLSAEHLLTLINDILDLSKIEAGRMEIHTVRFQLEALITGCLQTVEPLIKSERLRLKQVIESDLPWLSTDQDKVKQILMNLLSNAVKFTAEGSITITVRHQDGVITIAVTDTGIGIPAEALEHIFEEFHQGDSRTTRQYGGTGLGLAISRRLAQLLGGDITVQSTVGVGSIFTVRFPLHYDAAALIPRTVAASSREKHLSQREPGPSIRAIDDAPDEIV